MEQKNHPAGTCLKSYKIMKNSKLLSWDPKLWIDLLHGPHTAPLVSVRIQSCLGPEWGATLCHVGEKHSRKGKYKSWQQNKVWSVHRTGSRPVRLEHNEWEEGWSEVGVGSRRWISEGLVDYDKGFGIYCVSSRKSLECVLKTIWFIFKRSFWLLCGEWVVVGQASWLTEPLGTIDMDQVRHDG